MFRDSPPYHCQTKGTVRIDRRSVIPRRKQTIIRPTPHRPPSRRIALYIAEPSEYASRVHEGVMRYCHDRVGFSVNDFQDDANTDKRRGDLLSQPLPWADFQPDGVVGIFPRGAGVIRWIKSFGVPAVSMLGEHRESLPTVHVGPASIADLAIQHLLEMGYSNFAFVGVKGMVTVDQRRAALEKHLHDIGRPLIPYGLTTNPWPGLYFLEAQAAAEEGLHKMLLAAPKPLGVLAATDHCGRAVCVACRKLGLAVPHQVGVLGIDNYLASRACVPSLSSIHSPGEAVGYEAMKMLQRLFDGEAVTAPLLVRATRLISRQSTGAGPSSQSSDVVRALAVIRERACDGLTLDQLLDEVPMSRSTLERHFMAMLGRTPGQELLRVRIARAKELLRGTDLPVSQIAHMVGYERLSSFSEFFTKQVGRSPRLYRTAGDTPPQST